MFLTRFQAIEVWLFPLAALALSVAYHSYLYWEIRRRPQQTLIGFSNILRQQWVAMIMTEQRDLLAVQTLRNWTMAATFLASTAVLIWLAMIHVTFTSSAGPQLCEVFERFAATSPAWWTTKWSLLMLNFFFVFVNFTLAVRHFNHVGFLINLPQQTEGPIDVAFVAHRLNQGATHHTIGMRGYYFSVPLVLWLFGSVWLFIGVLILLPLLYRIDHRL